MDPLADRPKPALDDARTTGSPPGTGWRGALAAAGYTAAVALAGASLGLVAGLAYAARAAAADPMEGPLAPVSWLIGLPLYGAIGCAAGLVAGLLVMALIRLVRLARQFTAAR